LIKLISKDKEEEEEEKCGKRVSNLRVKNTQKKTKRVNSSYYMAPLLKWNIRNERERGGGRR
jgi:hypothetical protein